MNETIGKVADAILDDLCDRKGIKHELNAIQYDDPETWEEIREAVGRAAITAMSVPTTRIREVGGGAMFPVRSIDLFDEVWRVVFEAARVEDAS